MAVQEHILSIRDRRDYRLRKRLRWADRPVRVELSVARTKEGPIIEVGGEIGEEIFSFAEREPTRCLPATGLGPLRRYPGPPIANAEARDILPDLSVTVPLAEEEVFFLL